MKHRAFTILELLLATVLLCGLMISVLAVLTRVGIPSQAAGTLGTDDGGRSVVSGKDNRTIDAWVALLRADLEQAVVIESMSSGRISMVGYRSLEGEARQPRHRPVQIVYRIEKIGADAWLIREQSWLDDLSNQNVRRDLVCRGVIDFHLSADRSGVTPGSGPKVTPNIEPSPSGNHPAEEPGNSTSSGQPQEAPTSPAPVKLDDTVWHNSLPYFRSKAPAWLIEEARKQEAQRIRSGQGTGRPGGVAGQDVTTRDDGQVGSRPSTAAGAPSSAISALWRLSVHTSGDDKTQLHRLLILRRGD